MLKEINALIDSMHNPVLVIDKSGCLIACNVSAERIIRHPKELVIGKPLISIMKKSRLHNILKTGKTESVQKITIGGKIFISNRTSVRIDEKIVGAMAVLQDISELEHISNELSATRNLSQELTAIIEFSFDGIFP